MKPRVAITGMGVISPAGIGIAPLLSVLRNGHSCVRPIRSFDASDLPCRFGAEARDFDPSFFLDAKQAGRLNRAAQLFVAAATLALEDSKILNSSFDRSRAGVFEGTSLGGVQEILREHENFLKNGLRSVRPFILCTAMTGAAGSFVAMRYRFHGPVMAFSCGSVSSAYAISGAFRHLQLDELDQALAGGSEAPLCKAVLALFSRAGLLSSNNGSPESACRPFDLQRDGTVLGEGAAVLVLEKWEHAQKRGARIYAELCSAALTNDANSLFAPAPDAEQQSRCMAKALEKAGLTAGELDYISAHGTGTPLNDETETLAIKKACGERAYHIPVSSSKPALGHTLGACTALETVKTLLAIQHHFLPPTLNLASADPKCDLDYVPRCSRAADIHVALVNNTSFGGRNSSMVLKESVE